MTLPNFTAEADQLMRLFQVPAQQIHVVPNGADMRFMRAAGRFISINEHGETVDDDSSASTAANERGASRPANI